MWEDWGDGEDIFENFLFYYLNLKDNEWGINFWLREEGKCNIECILKLPASYPNKKLT